MDLNKVDLNLLVAFDVLVAEENVTRAAQRLSIGQSAMSSTLSRLRSLFHDELLTRRGRGVVATPFAKSLADPVRDVLAEFDAILSPRAAFDPANDQRTFRMLASDYFTNTFLRPLMERLASEAPGIKFHIGQTGDDCEEHLRTNRADLLFLPSGAWGQRLDEYPHQDVTSDRYLVAADRDHPDIGDSISLEQFTSLPYLATTSGKNASFGDRQLDALGVPRNVEVTAGFGPAPFMLRGTRLIMLIHERMAAMIGDIAGIKALKPPVDGLMPVTITMVWRRLTDHDPAHRWLRERVLALAAEMAAPERFSEEARQ
ncbi:LysR family transcriptional regulator [Streptomyces sp. NPDC101455]|uniref:LysR family transcriptional regulator n=1 Tax=Streptomyces sp. NPDC101455 TaxID=3366142 RepID=UPI0038020BC8